MNADVIAAVMIFMLGLLIGSFLNVCILRLPQGQSVVTPRSRCNVCLAQLGVLDLIPVLSYLLLRGRCRHCGTPFSARYALVELLTGGVYLWCYQVTTLTPALPWALCLASFLIVITYIDYDHQLILDKVLVWFAIAGVLINVFVFSVSLMDMLVGLLVGGSIMLLIAIASRGGMGGGDIKLMAVLGLWLNWKLVLMTMLISFILGGLSGVFLLAFKLKGRKEYVPFGPFIAIAAFICALYGTKLLAWYMTGWL